MSVSEIVQNARPRARHVYAMLALALAVLIIRQPADAWETTRFVLLGMIHVASLVIPWILLAAWITASGASDQVAAVFHGRTLQTVLAATLVGVECPH